MWLTLCAAVIMMRSLAVAAADSQWTQLGAQVPSTMDRPVWSMAASPAHPSVLLEATQGRGVLRSADGGITWSPVLTADEAAWVVRFDPQQNAVAYAGTPTHGLWRSADEGKTWTRAGAGLDPDVRAIDVAPGFLIVGTAHGVSYSTDSAASWHSLGLPALDIAAVAVVTDGTTTTLFAGADNGTASAAGYLLSATGLSGSWTTIHGNFPGDATVAALAVGAAPSGSTGHSIFAGTSQGLFRSDDSGATWTQVSGLPAADVNAVAVNPVSGDQVYVGSDADQGLGGVFRSLDHGSTWSPLAATGLPSKPRVTALALQPGAVLQVLAGTWNPTSGDVGLYRIPDQSASTTGSPAGSPAPGVHATGLPGAQAHLNSPPVRSSGGVELPNAWRNAGIGAGVVVALVILFAFRRRRVRRADFQAYRR